MNDNDEIPSREELRFLTTLRNLNIGANGRWFVLALVAIAIAAGLLKVAVFAACALGGAVIIEQIPGRWRAFLAYALYAYALVISAILLVIA